MRLCPSVEGSASPLITHRIGVDVCFARQRTFFHKCHRCVYRGKPANFEHEGALPTVDLPMATAGKAPKGKPVAPAAGKTGRRKAADGEKAAEAG